MRQTISIINQKGGVGKTTTAIALAGAMREKEKKVLLIDLDPQMNLTYALGLNPEKIVDKKNTVFEVLAQGASISGSVIKTTQGDLLPSHPRLNAVQELSGKSTMDTRLREALQRVAKSYDFILIDTPPALGVLTINALMASRYVLIPAQADLFSFQGVRQLWQTLKAVKGKNKTLKILGLVYTRHRRLRVTKAFEEVFDEAGKALKIPIFNTRIRECVALKESHAQQASIFESAPRSNAAEDYRQLLKEILSKM